MCLNGSSFISTAIEKEKTFYFLSKLLVHCTIQGSASYRTKNKRTTKANLFRYVIQNIDYIVRCTGQAGFIFYGWNFKQVVVFANSFDIYPIHNSLIYSDRNMCRYPLNHVDGQMSYVFDVSSGCFILT